MGKGAFKPESCRNVNLKQNIIKFKNTIKITVSQNRLILIEKDIN